MLTLLRQILQEKQADLIFCMIISIPLSFLLRIIYNKYLILAISVTSSFAIHSFIYPEQKYILWAQQAIVYILLRISPRNKVGIIIFVESFLYLCLVQIRRMSLSYGQNYFDVTSILMMQTFNYIGLGFNYQKGGLNKQQLDEGSLQRRIQQMPDILTYIGYVFFLPACLVGPVYEFKDYYNYLNRQENYANIPNTFMPAFKQTIIFIISTTIFLATDKFEQDYLITEQFAQQSYLMKIFYILMIIQHMEYKYIGAWSLGMISMKASGITYQQIKNEKNENVDNFQRVQVTSILQFQFNPSFKVKADTWNMSVQVALKRYIFDSVYNPKKLDSQSQKSKLRFKAQQITILTSALWHGLYPGYYITFIHWMLALQVSQQIYRIRQNHKFFDNLWTKYYFMYGVQLFLSNFAIAYFGLFFHLMTIDKIKIFINSTYYIPFIIVYIMNILIARLRIFSKRFPKKQIKKQIKPQIKKQQ